jgi:hypothetical protein
MSKDPQIHVAGRTVSTQPAGASNFFIWALLVASLWCGFASISIRTFGWNRLLAFPPHVLPVLTGTCALALLALAFVVARSRWCLLLLGLRRPGRLLGLSLHQSVSASATRLLTQRAFVVVVCAALTYLAASTWWLSSPLPRALRMHEFPSSFQIPTTLEGTAIDGTSTLPVVFWDYVTWIRADELAGLSLLLPYEKGPPAKLLGKVLFIRRSDNQLSLELSGKRPRAYPLEQVREAFSNTGELIFPSATWPLAYALATESGVAQTQQVSGRRSPMTLFQITRKSTTDGAANAGSGTWAVGVPWTGLNASTPDQDFAGRFAFLSPAGSVFQVRCPSPCDLGAWLERTSFWQAGGPETRRLQLQWTAQVLRKFLESPKSVNENKTWVILYLVSLLTQDPTEKEAYFHLGKLTDNPQTLRSAIRYGKDVGLDPARIAELEAKAAL